MAILAGRRALVTGGSRGIGRWVARGLAARGVRVAVWGRDEGRLARVLEELEASGPGGARAYRCDVADAAQVQLTAEKMQGEFGPVDVLVNNAGIVFGKPLLELSEREIEASFRVNALGLFWVTRAFLPAMIQRGRGHVVTVASAAGLIGVPRLADYCATKWAAVGFDEALRAELRRVAPSLRTTVVCPFYADTGMFEGARTRFPGLLPILRPERVAERIVRAVERGRRRVFLPPLVCALPLLRVLPTPAFDALASFFGVNDSMAEFVGREGASRRGDPEA